MNSIESFAPTTSASIPSSAEGTLVPTSTAADTEALGMLRSLIAGSGEPMINTQTPPPGQRLEPSPSPAPQGPIPSVLDTSEKKETKLHSPNESEMTLSASTMAALCSFFGAPNASSLNTLLTGASSSGTNRLPTEVIALLQSDQGFEGASPETLSWLGLAETPKTKLSTTAADTSLGASESIPPTNGSVSQSPSDSSDESSALPRGAATLPPQTQRVPLNPSSAIDQLHGLMNEPSADPLSALATPPPMYSLEPSDRPIEGVKNDLPNEQSFNLGQAILQTLDNQSSSSVNVVPETQAHVQRLEQVSALMTEMADRVLVTDPLHGQTQEVRIKLADHIIPGTEVRVWHGEGGQLRVEFETSSPYWAQVLNEASPLLAQRLNEKLVLPEAAMVSVNQQSGQPEDGRSRNRYTPWDLAGAANENES